MADAWPPGGEEGRSKRRTRRRAVSMQRPVDVRMGEPVIHEDDIDENRGDTQGTETSQYLQERKVERFRK